MIMKTDRGWLRIATGGILLAALGATPAFAQDAAQGVGPADDAVAALDTAAIITPDAQAVLDRMTATLNALQRFEVTADVTRDEMLPFGYKLQNHEAARMWVERPNRMRVEVEGDIKDHSYVYDGTQLTMFASDLNVYAAAPAPDTIAGLVVLLLDAGVEMPLIDMLYHGVAGNLTDAVRVGLVVGDSVVDGIPTDHLAFRQADVDWQLWVEKGSQALPRKMLITTRYEVGDPQYQAKLKWNLKPRLSANSFKFVPPSGATEIPFHTELASNGGGQ